jgi:flagellar hook-associated protein 3 FlgL
MRISTLQMHRQGVNSILDLQSQLFRTQQQLSTGKRMINSADDPTGSARLVGLSESATVTEQYQRNIQHLQSRLELEDTVLASVGDNLQRARELAVQALNDTNSAEDRVAIAKEVRQIMDQVLGVANSKDGQGEYLFAGFQAQNIPFSHDGVGNFSYAGDQGQRQIQVGPTRQLAYGDSGLDVFMKVADASGTVAHEDVFSTLYKLASDLEADAPSDTTLDQLDNALEHLVGFRATAGARLNAAQSQKDINESFLLQLEQTRSNIEDLDYADAATRLSQESVALQAAQQAFVRVQNLNLFNFL